LLKFHGRVQIHTDKTDPWCGSRRQQGSSIFYDDYSDTISLFKKEDGAVHPVGRQARTTKPPNCADEKFFHRILLIDAQPTTSNSVWMIPTARVVYRCICGELTAALNFYTMNWQWCTISDGCRRSPRPTRTTSPHPNGK
jgi:hypothetical protein